ncbi:extracellular solute-binding protein [Luteipulveratus mongoliensis]|uniref:extracellular solute-binding protein n=1 Tax=Luteipulveratus mongoliensis TaxID=571913 RepID=UPI000695EC08|nr:extracellular solute-binding protein [Luteipulveratus mongoliensis]
MQQGGRNRTRALVATAAVLALGVGAIGAIQLWPEDDKPQAIGSTNSPGPTNDASPTPTTGPTSDAGNTASTSPTDPPTAVPCGSKAPVTGAGLPAFATAMASYSKTYDLSCPGATSTFEPLSTDAGIEKFLGGKADFAASDRPLNVAEMDQAKHRCNGPALHLPMDFSALEIAYNLTDPNRAAPEGLVLSAPVLAKIFTGSLKRWNDPSISALNPGVSLPDVPIVPIFRSDQSTTTQTFQQYLTAASSGAWTKGETTAFTGGAGRGVQGADDVVREIKSTKGAIAYLDPQGISGVDTLYPARIHNGHGATQFVGQGPTKAIAGTTVRPQSAGDASLFTPSLYRPTATAAYPLVQVTDLIVCSTAPNADRANAIKSFLLAAAATSESKGYVRMPANLKSTVVASVRTITPIS